MTRAPAASVYTRPRAHTSSRSKPQQRLSHRRLMRDVSAAAPPRHGRHVPLSAIVVPSARDAEYLERALHLSAQAATLLVVLASRDSRAADVAALMASTPGCRGLVVEMPSGYRHPYFAHETSINPSFRKANAERDSDLSLKRNIGLILARLLGWTKIMYLDDDISDIRLDQVARISAQLNNHQVAGLVTRRFPDNSVVCHANRLSGANQDNFITGAAMGVNCADQPLPFFPDIYNEDWFFFMKHAARGGLPCVGHARQLEYKPFQDSTRAAREEFGDLLAEGLYALIGSGDRPESATKDYWEMFSNARLALLDRISTGLERLETNEASMAMSSVQAARDQASKITPEHCVAFLEAWREDRRRFEAIAAKAANVGNYAEAFDHLELENWRSAEFGNADSSRMPPPVEVSSPATGRRSAAAGAPRRGRRRRGGAGVRPSA
jgi:hypothetical protein